MEQGQSELQELAQKAQEATSKYLVPPEDAGSNNEKGEDEKEKKTKFGGKPCKEESACWNKVERLVAEVARAKEGPNRADKEEQLRQATGEVVAATRKSTEAAPGSSGNAHTPGEVQPPPPTGAAAAVDGWTDENGRRCWPANPCGLSEEQMRQVDAE